MTVSSQRRRRYPTAAASQTMGVQRFTPAAEGLRGMRRPSSSGCRATLRCSHSAWHCRRCARHATPLKPQRLSAELTVPPAEVVVEEVVVAEGRSPPARHIRRLRRRRAARRLRRHHHHHHRWEPLSSSPAADVPHASQRWAQRLSLPSLLGTSRCSARHRPT